MYFYLLIDELRKYLLSYSSENEQSNAHLILHVHLKFVFLIPDEEIHESEKYHTLCLLPFIYSIIYLT